MGGKKTHTIGTLMSKLEVSHRKAIRNKRKRKCFDYKYNCDTYILQTGMNVF